MLHTPADQPGPRRHSRRKGNHDGTCYYDAKTSRWRGEIQLDGHRRKVSGKTQREVQQQLADLRHAYFTQTLPDPHQLTVEEYLSDWLETVVKRRRRISTYLQYESPIRVHVYPRLGKKRLVDLHPRDLERLYAHLEAGVDPRFYKKSGRLPQGKGLSPKSIRNLHTGLHAAFERAVKHRLLQRNPADAVELPALPRRKKMTITLEDIQQLIAVMRDEGDRTWPLWVFLANTGLRIGEALALRWANVDLNTGWILVEEDLERTGTIGEVKTEASEREIPLTRFAQEALAWHQERQAVEQMLKHTIYKDHGLVFPTLTGRPSSVRNALRSLKRAARRASIPEEISLHDFRRMTASLLVASGVDITTAAAILGHKRASVLLDVYARALRGKKREAADKLQQAFGPAIPAVPPILPAPPPPTEAQSHS